VITPWARMRKTGLTIAIRKGFKTSRQEDTHEFFRFVTDALQAQAQNALGITK